MFPFFGILSLCFILLKVILRFGKTVLLTLYSGWRIGRSTWGSGFSLLELFWQLILKTITVARNFQLQFLFLNLIAVSYESSQTEFWKGGTKGFTRDTWLRPKLICDAWILQRTIEFFMHRNKWIKITQVLSIYDVLSFTHINWNLHFKVESERLWKHNVRTTGTIVLYTVNLCIYEIKSFHFIQLHSRYFNNLYQVLQIFCSLK